MECSEPRESVKKLDNGMAMARAQPARTLNQPPRAVGRRPGVLRYPVVPA